MTMPHCAVSVDYIVATATQSTNQDYYRLESPGSKLAHICIFATQFTCTWNRFGFFKFVGVCIANLGPSVKDWDTALRFAICHKTDTVQRLSLSDGLRVCLSVCLSRWRSYHAVPMNRTRPLCTCWSYARRSDHPCWDEEDDASHDARRVLYRKQRTLSLTSISFTANKANLSPFLPSLSLSTFPLTSPIRRLSRPPC